ncbi:polysaccharide pyruvyl transferase family protein [Kluyvera sichuanensis]
MKNKELKRVGVVTMHSVINYGSFLQAYATQHIIEKLGYKCDIIDYDFPNEWHFKRGIKGPRGIRKIISNIIHKLGFRTGYRKKNKINKAIKKYLNLTEKYKNPSVIKKKPPLYDIYITGSDQTWNPKHTKGDDVFLLSFAPTNAKKMSFSASLAGNEMSNEYRDIFKKYLAEYDFISIRDSGGNKVMKELVGKEVAVTLDPTLMMSRDDWSLFLKNKNRVFSGDGYIIFYLITHSFDVTPYIYELLKKLQDKTGLKVYSFSDIPAAFDINYDKCADISVEDFIELFERASFVVTSSFHGTAFAANFGIPLYSVIDSIETADDRQISLLRALDIEQCIVPLNKSFDEINPIYDKEEEQHNLDGLRRDSLEYLSNALSS